MVGGGEEEVQRRPVVLVGVGEGRGGEPPTPPHPHPRARLLFHPQLGCRSSSLLPPMPMCLLWEIVQDSPLSKHK